jgi:carotenoid cleavage dioxygenase-like enzyme
MIQAYRIDANQVSHSGRFVRTEKFQREEDAQRFLFNGAGSVLPGSMSSRNNDSINVANTNVQPFNGELLALWQGGSAYRIDPESLETLGKQAWSEELAGVPFSAHPRVDANGDWWNFGSMPIGGMSALVLYHIGIDGQLKQSRVHQLDQAGYQHDFILTPNYLVFLNSSLIASKHAETFVGSFEWDNTRPSQLLIFDKRDLSLIKTLEVPPAFVFHFGNGWELGEDILFTAAQYQDGRFMLEGMGRLAQRLPGPYFDDSRLLRYQVNIRKGSVKIEQLAHGIEFPSYDRRFPFKAQPILGVCDSDLRPESIQSGIALINPESGERQVYDYGAEVVVEEPQFVPDPSGRLGSGYVLHSYLNFKKKRSGIAVLRADALADGPVGLAEMDRVVPLGFHGCFQPA